MDEHEPPSVSRRHAVGLEGLAMAAAGGTLAQQAGQTPPNSQSGAPALQDPRSNYPKPPFKPQTQPATMNYAGDIYGAGGGQGQP